MDKRIVNLLIGVGIAVIAIIVINGQMQSREKLIQELIKKGQLVEVVVAKDDIPRETTITSDMVKMSTVPSKTLQPGDLTSLDSVIGKFTITDILKDQHLNSESVKPLIGFKYLSEGVPTGMRAITISVDKLSAVEGLLRPGDKVDIIGTFSFPSERGQNPPIVVTLFQGVKVLATNKNLSPYRAEGKADTVTMALKPEDIKMLTYSLELGKIRLVLRAPTDTSEDYEYSALTLEGLLNKLGMIKPSVPEERPATVEIYKGSKQEEVPVAK
jgi:pilus assembly protein CpaB